ncbi:hypothetical protein SNE40_020163 [Patella caerulea]|uniref:Rab-GAP TBC domain-containing protein n=2 Tax=Patella caerulea TaxID=87958 RepID=A0AAN8GJV7_PATCE
MALDTYVNMSFSSIFKKATNLLGIGTDSVKSPPLDGEIIYCKNNVCVHPPAPLTLEVEHHPGYLTVRAQQDDDKGPTLFLTWIPNASLKKNPKSIESSPSKPKGFTPRASPRKAPKQEFAKPYEDVTPSPVESPFDQASVTSNCLSEQKLDKDQVPVQNKKHSVDNTSLSSDFSLGSRDESHSLDSWQHKEDSGSRLGNKLSSSCKSQTDSGIGSEEAITTHNLSIIQNNEKGTGLITKPSKVGINVNDLHEKNCNSNGEVKNLLNTTSSKDDDPSSQESDGLTSEEQLAAMMKRNKLHAKARDSTDPARAVKSIVMDGDQLQVVTEEKDVFLEASKDPHEKNINKNESKFETSSSQSTDVESLSSDSTNPSPSDSRYESLVAELRQNGIGQNIPEINYYCDTLEDSGKRRESIKCGIQVPNELDLSNFIIPPPNTPMLTPDISVTRCRNDSSSSSTTTSGPDSHPPTPYSSDAESLPGSPSKEDSVNSLSTSSAGSITTYNMTFPENSVSYSNYRKERKSAKEQVCGVFSVDLGQMRSLRLFYSDNECTQGQVVIASPESQYKILHFHSGGLDKLAEIFEQWNLFRKSQTKDSDTPYRQFLVMKPQVTDDQCHPEEGVYPRVTEDVWQSHMMDDGIIEDDYQLRKAVFFGGLDPLLRHEAWPFLLKFYPFHSTFEEREKIRNDKYIEYQNIRKQRESMNEKDAERFWRAIQCTVEKDVVRTDRSHRYFRGENNPNIEILKNILLNYATAHPQMGYTQGMSDLLAPILAEIQHEVYAYWCFEGLMQRTIFVSSPRDSDMDKQLSYLRELMNLMVPKFYKHLVKLGDDAMELLFCHRWILLCFKREFSERDALVIWEVCWSHYQTDYFHLFICVAIVCIYGDDVVEQNLPADEILLHFSSLALHMNGRMVLKKARGLLHQYRKRRKIPCTLHGLCTHCDPGMWDSGHVPTVECIGHPDDTPCPYSSTPSSPTSPN